MASLVFNRACSTLFLLIFSLVANVAHAQQMGKIKSDDTVRSTPAPSGAAAGKVKANSKVEIVDRKGFWVKIKSGGTTGWVKMSNVAAEGGQGSGLSGLSGLSSGRLGSGNIVSASGTRGLSSEELKSAKPNFDAVKQVQGAAVSGKEAARFAAEGKLKTRRIDYVHVQ